VVRLVDPLTRFVLLSTDFFPFGFFGVVAVEEAAFFAVAFGVFVEGDYEGGGKGA
jgi:hypothetical protein